MRIADGGILRCDKEIRRCKWLAQGVEFCSNLKVLELGCYDVILGMDWLEKHCPMMVHWGHKVLSFSKDGEQVTLQGISHTDKECHMISVAELRSLVSRRAVS